MFTISVFTSDDDYISLVNKMCSTVSSVSLAFIGDDHLNFFNRKNLFMTDIAIIDYSFQSIKPLNLISKIRKANPEILILQIVDVDQKNEWPSLLGAGLDAIIPANISIKESAKCLEKLFRKGSFIHPDLAKPIFVSFEQKQDTTLQTELKRVSKNVLDLLSEGKSYAEIASTLNISLDSVRYYIKDIYKKLDVNNKGAAISLYLKGHIA